MGQPKPRAGPWGQEFGCLSLPSPPVREKVRQRAFSGRGIAASGALQPGRRAQSPSRMVATPLPRWCQWSDRQTAEWGAPTTRRRGCGWCVFFPLPRGLSPLLDSRREQRKLPGGRLPALDYSATAAFRAFCEARVGRVRRVRRREGEDIYRERSRLDSLRQGSCGWSARARSARSDHESKVSQ